MSRRTALLVSALLVLAVVGIAVYSRHHTAPTQSTNTTTNVSSVTNAPSATGILFSTTDEPDSLALFHFSTRLPNAWISQYDGTNMMLLFSPLSAGQSDSGDTIIAATRLTGSTWPTVNGGVLTEKMIDVDAARGWAG